MFWLIEGLEAFFLKNKRTFSIFHFVINGFHVFGNKFFSKENKYNIILHFFSFLANCCLFSLSMFEEGAIEYILGTKVWLYGFQSIFWQVLIDF